LEVEIEAGKEKLIEKTIQKDSYTAVDAIVGFSITVKNTHQIVGQGDESDVKGIEARVYVIEPTLLSVRIK
jgi:hypothetical protein